MIRKLLTVLGLGAAAGCGKSDGLTGSPNRIIYKDSAGRTVTAADLKKADGNYRWELAGTGAIPQKAKDLHERARVLGGKGELEGAVKLLVQAAEVAPDWAYPTYDLAYTYLLLGRSGQALDAYEKVDRLEPGGFFTAKSALWALRKEKEGAFPTGTYARYLKIEWVEKDSEKLAIARSILESVPNYALALKECALRTEGENEKSNFLEQALAAQPDAETYGLLMVNKAIWLSNAGKQDEAVKILGELVLSPNSTVGTVALAKSAMGFVVGKRS